MTDDLLAHGDCPGIHRHMEEKRIPPMRRRWGERVCASQAECLEYDDPLDRRRASNVNWNRMKQWMESQRQGSTHEEDKAQEKQLAQGTRLGLGAVDTWKDKEKNP